MFHWEETEKYRGTEGTLLRVDVKKKKKNYYNSEGKTGGQINQSRFVNNNKYNNNKVYEG